MPAGRPFRVDSHLIRSRLSGALHGVGHPPDAEPWNCTDISDLLPAPGDLMPAAVLVPIVLRPQGASLVLTRRNEGLTHHAGQVSFPGGRIEAGDTGVVDAALREAYEEIGLDPAQVEVMGYLDRYATITGFGVTPVLGLVNPDASFVRDPGEVAEIFEVPLDFVLDPSNRELHTREFRGRVRSFHVIRFGAHEIWGATAAMIVNLGERLDRAP